MLQQVIVVLIFLGALFYVGRLIYNSFQEKSACQSGCAKCGAVDFNKIEQQIKAKGLQVKN